MRKVNRVDARAMRYRDLGTVVLERDGVELPVGGPKPAVLLAMLLIHRNRRVSAGALMDALWGADAGKRNKATLESHVRRLRRVLEPGRRHGESPTVLVNEVGGYRLTVPAGNVDSPRFTARAGGRAAGLAG